MKSFFTIFSFLFTFNLSAQCLFSDIDSIPNNVKEEFKSKLIKFIFQKKVIGSITISNELLDSFKICGKDTSKHGITDHFKTYLPESRQTYLDSISKLKSPWISHYAIGTMTSHKTKEQKSIDMGEIFITHKKGILKSRFTVFIWDDKIYLMNLMIAPE